MVNNKYIVSATPHIRSKDSVDGIMKDVVIGLLPATLVSFYFFGIRAALVVLLSVSSCIVFEYAFQKIAGKTITIGDWSAVVTGLLLAMNLPVSVPFWIPIVGSFFAIVIVKQIFGGLGQNFMNPALAARAFLQTSYTEYMVYWTEPIKDFTSMGVDAITTVTPLDMLKLTDMEPLESDYINAIIGNIGGSLGETCAIAILIGGIYLIAKKVISWRIPVIYMLTFGILTFVFGRNGLFTGHPIYEMLVGGFMLGAFFMATDYSSSPVSDIGQVVMGIGCGVLTFAIRTYGGYPEGVCYSILLMNLTVPLIDRYIRPRVYGVSKRGVKHG